MHMQRRAMHARGEQFDQDPCAGIPPKTYSNETWLKSQVQVHVSAHIPVKSYCLVIRRSGKTGIDNNEYVSSIQ